jgi:DNA uptake protein ComE-like DNA-binding protein
LVIAKCAVAEDIIVSKGFLLGVVVGAGFGILLAPDAGENTRRKLRQRGERLFGRFNDPVEPDGSGSEAVAQPNTSSSGSESQPANLAAGTGSDVQHGADQSVAEVLNHARKEELMSVNGIGDATAKRIIRNRPYDSAEEAVQEEVIPDATLEKVKEQLVKGKSSTKEAA